MMAEPSTSQPMAPHVGPGEGGIVEDARVLGLAAKQVVHHALACDAEGFGGAVEIQTVARFVLHLGEQDSLALEAWGPGDPVAFRQLADDFGMSMLADLADKRPAITLGHPVEGLDLDVAVEALLELPLFGGELIERAGGW